MPPSRDKEMHHLGKLSVDFSCACYTTTVGAESEIVESAAWRGGRSLSTNKVHAFGTGRAMRHRYGKRKIPFPVASGRASS